MELSGFAHWTQLASPGDGKIVQDAFSCHTTIRERVVG